MDLIILHGADTFRSKKRLQALREGFKKKYDPLGANITAYQTPFDLAQIRNSLGQTGMFAKKRLVVLYDFYSTAALVEQEKFNDWLAADAFPDAVILCWESKDLSATSSKARQAGSGKSEKIKKSKSTLKAKKFKTPAVKVSWPEHAKVEVFEPLAQAQLLAWIRQEVKRLGGSIAPDAVMQLANNLGPDLWALSNVLAQLVAASATAAPGADGRAAAGDRPIDLKTVNAWTQLPMDENIFHFTDALSARNLAEALTLFQSQLNLGVHPLVLHSMLIRQVRTLVMVEEGVKQGLAPGAIAEESSLHPFVAQKAVMSVKRFQPGELKKLFIQLTELDIEMKTGKIEPEIALANFIARVCVVS
ncbi:DNA polymerase III subunit delta [Candidatus Parcubacteria bacterium]|jgi:DNA polymerase III delta subunit|nr:MAG: DNA polymerase III subunit delta [Candidatus Parcubacteria bacterium]